MAVHDLLFSEGDRHGGNVHIDEHSKLRFIDNDNALGFMFGMRSWFQTRGLDSIFIPVRPPLCVETSLHQLRPRLLHLTARVVVVVGAEHRAEQHCHVDGQSARARVARLPLPRGKRAAGHIVPAGAGQVYAALCGHLTGGAAAQVPYPAPRPGGAAERAGARPATDGATHATQGSLEKPSGRSAQADAVGDAQGFERTLDSAMAGEKVKYEETIAVGGKMTSTWRPSQEPRCPTGTRGLWGAHATTHQPDAPNPFEDSLWIPGAVRAVSAAKILKIGVRGGHGAPLGRGGEASRF
jgi:hypothetical protein